MVLMGQVGPTQIDLDDIEAKLSDPKYAQVAQSLREIGFNFRRSTCSRPSPARGAPDLGEYLKDAQVNRDRNLRLQYLAGLGVNVYAQDEIYRHILQYRKYPAGLFTGSPERMEALRAAGNIGQ